MFDLSNNQSLNELQKKAFVQTQIFNLAYEDYVKKYNYYNAPENINILDIITILKKWISQNYVSRNDKYNQFIK